MEEKIKKIKEYFAFIDEFNRLLRDNPITMFQCNNEDFKNKFSVLYLNLKNNYKFVKGIEIEGTCSQTWLDKFYEIRNLTLQNLIDMSNLKHKLVIDSRIYWIDGKPYSYQSPNLDNELCEKIYKTYGASAFSVYDTDWRKAEKLTAEVFTNTTAKENLKAFFVPEHTPVVIEETLAIPDPVAAPAGKSEPKKPNVKKVKTTKSKK